MTTEKHQPALICLFLAIFAFSVVQSSRTKAFYDLTQLQPLMTYECYASGNTVEPPNAVNLAVLLDGTKPKDKQILATSWYEIRGQLDSYVTGSFTVVYNDTAGVGMVKTSSLTYISEVVQPPYNGAAYYFKITITSQKNRVVYKVYDTSGTCFNAATLVFKTCYDIQDECCSQQKFCQGQGISLSKPRQDLGCSKLQFTRYPQAEPYPVCADYHSCT